ncbi:nardilysin [Fopius arisanus]|uniref:Nardilysin n=1 Tax=Fopius arisanus TaxID=64838 RepID=A0A0C9R5C2_9HYME|nr:PREDICTED: nardilysin-like [Fopius arisanus]
MFSSFRPSTLLSCAVKNLASHNRIMPKRSLGVSPVKKKFKSHHNQISQKMVIPQSDSPSVEDSNLADDRITASSMSDIKIEEATANIKVEYLDIPIKSDNDKKEYRVIKLPNGLTALLIADLYTANGACGNDEISEADTDESSTDGSDAECSSSSDASELMESYSDDECTSPKAPKKDEKMAACGLCVGVGSFSDPPEIQGLAHFLEHMVFMGSKKYPLENDFDAFITKRGGSDNASTECEQTTFYFEIDEKHLLSALDRFAQFFINPLMLRDAITREREAVESEFQMALPSDFYRKEQLFCSFAESHHPAKKFPWGNLVSLRDMVTDDKLYEELHNFRERHYSAHRMTMTIQARLPLDTLEDYVKQCFVNVPCNNLPPDDFSRFNGSKSFDTDHFRRIYKIKPIKDICQVELTWAMGSLHHLYRSKPHQYVSWLIGHEGKGSLISYLRKKMWCLDVFSGNGESGFEHSSMYALFSLSLVLTDEGHSHLKKVLDAIFSYINMIRKLGPQKRIFDEIKMIEDTNFRFADEVPPAEYVEDLCENMHFYSPEDYITGSDLYFEYNPEGIAACMEALTPDNVNIILFDKKFDDEKFEKVEPWFQTKYTDSKIPEDWIKSWKTLEPFEEFHLPEPNIFITDDFSLIPIESEILYPSKIHQDALSEIWYKPDSKFRLPECYMHFYFISPEVVASPEGAGMTDLMVTVLKQLLVEELYPATAAELNYQIEHGENGLLIKVCGFNQRLLLLLETISRHIANCSELITESLFQIMKEEQLKDYYNTFLKPSKLNKDVRLSILIVNHWTAVDKHAAVSGVTYDQFKNFVKYFCNHVYVQCLVQGNMREEEVIKNALKCFKILGCKPLLPNTFPRHRVNILPKGEVRCCRVRNFNGTDANSVVTNYYQSDLFSTRLSVIIELLMILMEEPIFNQLRTQEQLGYNVFAMLRNTSGVFGYSVTVHTQADKFSVEFIDERIEGFLKSFNEILKKSTEKELEGIKQALIKVKQCADIHLKEEVTRNWGEITANHYVFDRLAKEVEMVSEIGLDELRDWLENHIIGGKNLKKLSVQVVGNDKSKSSGEENCVPDNEEIQKNSKRKNLVKYGGEFEYSLKLMKNLPTEKLGKPDDYYITDIEEFKHGLFVYPVTVEVD